MKKTFPIPKGDQLRAAAHGWDSIYKLLNQYDTKQKNNALAYRSFLTITEKDLADYLRVNLELAQRHILPQAAAEPYHDVPILKAVEDHYEVYANDHGKPINVKKFNTIWEAAAAYIFYFW